MASNKTQTQAQAETVKRGRGRPPADPDADPRQTVLAAMQKTTDRVCLQVVDRATGSLGALFQRAARAGVPEATSRKVIEALSSAVDDLEAALERAYSAPAARPAVESRVKLL